MAKTLVLICKKRIERNLKYTFFSRLFAPFCQCTFSLRWHHFHLSQTRSSIVTGATVEPKSPVDSRCANPLKRISSLFSNTETHVCASGWSARGGCQPANSTIGNLLVTSSYTNMIWSLTST